MHDLLSSLLGVPATILIAAGLGLAAVTIWSRLFRRDAPIAWRHCGLGTVMLALGIALLQADISWIGL